MIEHITEVLPPHPSNREQAMPAAKSKDEPFKTTVLTELARLLSGAVTDAQFLARIQRAVATRHQPGSTVTEALTHEQQMGRSIDAAHDGYRQGKEYAQQLLAQRETTRQQ